ncbi:N-acetyltransferase [Streptomyces candidus]|nr:N-acetyltransferase [Streptomyces candidus]
MRMGTTLDLDADVRARRRGVVEDRFEPGAAPTSADIAVFALARAEDGTPLGCAGLRALGDAAGELKRMYVIPAGRGTGVAPALLEFLEQWARDRGWTRLRLETGLSQPDAVHFCTRSGYRRIPDFGTYTGLESTSLCFERELTPVL